MPRQGLSTKNPIGTHNALQSPGKCHLPGWPSILVRHAQMPQGSRVSPSAFLKTPSSLSEGCLLSQHAPPAFPEAPQPASLEGAGCCAHICPTHGHESFLHARQERTNRDNQGPPAELTQGATGLCRESKKEGTKLRAETCWLHSSSPPHLTCTRFLEHSSHLPLPGPLSEAQIAWACFLPWCTRDMLNETCPPQTHINSPMQEDLKVTGHLTHWAYPVKVVMLVSQEWVSSHQSRLLERVGLAPPCWLPLACVPTLWC